MRLEKEHGRSGGRGGGAIGEFREIAMLPTEWSDGILSDAFAWYTRNTENGRLCVRLFRKQIGAYSKNCKYQRSVPKKIPFSPLSLSLSHNSRMDSLFLFLLCSTRVLFFYLLYNRTCKNFLNIWIYLDRTEIKIANINGSFEKDTPFFFLFRNSRMGSFYTYSIFFFSLLFNSIRKTFFGYISISMRITFFALFQSTLCPQFMHQRWMNSTIIAALFPASLQHLGSVSFFFFHHFLRSRV